MTELSDVLPLVPGKNRGAGGGRKSSFEKLLELDEVFLQVLSEQTAGSPMDEKVK